MGASECPRLCSEKTDTGEVVSIEAAPIGPSKTPLDAPADHGLLVSIDGSGRGWFQFTRDVALSNIHRNLHVPASLQSLRELGGGGSGVTIVQGVDPEFGSVVMKHGGARDLAELFALAKISHELDTRSANGGDVAKAADDMRKRTPDFRFIYISRSHLRDRGVELWAKLRAVHHAAWYFGHTLSGDSSHEPVRQVTSGKPEMPTFAAEANEHTPTKVIPLHRVRTDPVVHPTPTDGVSVCAPRETMPRVCSVPERACSAGEKLRGIRIFTPASNAACETRAMGVSAELVDDRLQLYATANADAGAPRIRCCASGSDYVYLVNLFTQLRTLQRKHSWKFTMAQATIGDEDARTASSVLAAGKLKDELLRALLDDFIHVINNLFTLTSPSEVAIVETVRRELALLSSSEDDAASISEVADAFVGFAIKKNFAQKKGRFAFLRDLGRSFREEKLRLEPDEVLPARLLGVMLKEGTRFEDVVGTAPGSLEARQGSTALDMYISCWRELLEHATQLKPAAATDRIWTCGLTDSGLHNLFLDETGVTLFDLGEPALMPLPAFLTKFLMSFFHTLGMQEERAGKWENRFVPGALLSLTVETKKLLPHAEFAFKTALDRIGSALFSDDVAVRRLLVKYVVLQLLSDAGFCLQRWMEKGGGEARIRTLALGKWLWRALWDLYVASVVANRDW